MKLNQADASFLHKMNDRVKLLQTQVWIQIQIPEGLLPNSQLTEPQKVPLSWLWSCAIHLRATSQKMLQISGIILCMRPANERRRYNVTSSPIGWAHSQNDPWISITKMRLKTTCLRLQPHLPGADDKNATDDDTCYNVR